MKWLAYLMIVATFAGEAAAQERVSSSYRIGPRDVVQVRIEELDELDSEQTVAEDGSITLSVIGTVQAQGLTEDQLALRLRSRLEDEGLRRATVSVSVAEYRSRPVSVLGAVVNPGNHFVPGRASLMQVLMGAGGLAEKHGQVITVRRRSVNGLSDQIEIPAAGLLEEGDPIRNIPIFAGDHINIPLAREITVHFLGQVRNSGSLTFAANQRATLLAAIARAGGLEDTASKKIRIKRQTPAGETLELTADYRAVLNGREPDLELHDGDFIIVKESFF